MMFLDTCVPTLRNRTNKNNNKCFLHKWFKVVQPIAIPMCELFCNYITPVFDLSMVEL